VKREEERGKGRKKKLSSLDYSRSVQINRGTHRSDDDDEKGTRSDPVGDGVTTSIVNSGSEKRRIPAKEREREVFFFYYFEELGFPIPSPFLTCVNAPSENHLAFASSTFDRSFEGSTNSRPAFRV